MKKAVLTTIFIILSSSNVLASTFNVVIHDPKSKRLSIDKKVVVGNADPVSLSDTALYKYTSVLYTKSDGSYKQNAYIKYGYNLLFSENNNELRITISCKDVAIHKVRLFHGDPHLPVGSVSQFNGKLSLLGNAGNYNAICSDGSTISVDSVKKA
jgi:hypothetical protein